MFIFSDEFLLAAVIAARRRGVNVRVMLNAARRNGVTENDHVRLALQGADIEVRDGHPKFEMTHQKSMVIDDREAFIASLNWQSGSFSAARDYALVTTDRQEVKEMVACFDADWTRQEFLALEDSRLIWCPDNGRHRLVDFIDAARHSLWVQNERYQDMVIVEGLVRATLRGVKVHILTRPPHTLKPDKLIEGVGGLRILQDVGAKVHTMRQLKLHAKAMLADGNRAIVGSINLSPGSFDSRRELAIETSHGGVVKRLRGTMGHDWTESHVLDLSDLGLLHDLQKRKGLDPRGLFSIRADRAGNPN